MQTNSKKVYALACAYVVAMVGLCRLMVKALAVIQLLGQYIELGYHFSAEKPGQGIRAYVQL